MINLNETVTILSLGNARRDFALFRVTLHVKLPILYNETTCNYIQYEHTVFGERIPLRNEVALRQKFSPFVTTQTEPNHF